MKISLSFEVYKIDKISINQQMSYVYVMLFLVVLPYRMIYFLRRFGGKCCRHLRSD